MIEQEQNVVIPSKSRGLPGAGSATEDRVRPVRCQICRARITPGVDLGHQPVSDLILSRSQLNRPETYYPMQLHHCGKCGLTQLGHTVNPKVVYKNFPFVSGTTQTATRHLQSLPKQLVATSKEKCRPHRVPPALYVRSRTGGYRSACMPLSR